MNEQFIVKSFAPAKALDIGFKKDTFLARSTGWAATGIHG